MSNNTIPTEEIILSQYLRENFEERFTLCRGSFAILFNFSSILVSLSLTLFQRDKLWMWSPAHFSVEIKSLHLIWEKVFAGLKTESYISDQALWKWSVWLPWKEKQLSRWNWREHFPTSMILLTPYIYNSSKDNKAIRKLK